MTSNGKNSITLRITGPDGRTRESVTELESLILGSGAGAAIQIPDPKVSNLHVMLKVEKNGVVKAIDLGSEHGTTIGEKPLQGPMPLNSGDVIRLGASRVEVLFGAPASNQAANPAAPQVRQGNAHTTVLTAPGVQPPAAPAARPTSGINVGTTPAPRAPQAPGRRVMSPQASAPARPAPAQVAARGPVPPGIVAAPAGNAVSRPAAGGQVRGPVAAHGAATARRAEVLPEPNLPINAPATGEVAPRPGHRILQVAMVWGDHLLGSQHYGDGVPVTIGEGRKNEFHVFAPEVGERFTLVRPQGDKALVNLPSGAGVTLFSGARQFGLEQLRAEGRLRPGEGGGLALDLGLEERLKVSLGTVCFLLRFVSPSARVPVKRLEKADAAFFAIAALVLLVGAAFLAWLVVMPKGDRRSVAVSDEDMATVVKLLVKPQKKVVVPKPKPKEDKSGAEEGAKAQGDEGAFGKPDAKQAEADPSKKGSPKVDPNQKEKDRRKVFKMGLLGAINSNGAASDVFGPGGLGSGINDKLGGLRGGAGLTDRQGVGGLGSRGTGTGGGGTGLGLGGLGTKGNGPGTGGHGIELGGHGHDTTRIIPGKTVVVGGLSREVIEKVIRSHQREIKYCYDTELNKIPDLAGKVAVSFVIGPDGTVQDANVSETSLNNSNAEQCMITRIKRWRFPEPQGGGIVSVNFPWVFKPAGD